MSSLSPSAQKIIADYLKLPIGVHQVNCPYFNNRQTGLHGGLRVLIGKGNPKDIADEALIMSLREKIELKKLTDEQLKKFLVDNHLGVDCSGLAYYVLEAELKSRHKPALSKSLHRPWLKPWRRLIAHLRAPENTGVRTFANDVNSKTTKIADVKPGDIITMLNTGLKNDRHHMLIVHEVDNNNGQLIIHYTHSFKWTTDGLYNHGARQGQIKIVDPTKPLLQQEWTENNLTGDQNETYLHAKQAKSLELRRLIVLLTLAP